MNTKAIETFAGISAIMIAAIMIGYGMENHSAINLIFGGILVVTGGWMIHD